MLFVLAGAVVGVLIGLGRIPAIHDVVVAIADGATRAGVDLTGALLDRSGMDPDGMARIVTETVALALMPGIVAGVVLAAAKTGPFIRRLGAFAAVAVGIWTAITYGTAAGVGAGIVLIVIGGMFAFLVGSVLSFVGAALSAVIATTQIRLFFVDDDTRFRSAAAMLADAAGVGDVALWALVLAVASLALPVVVLFAAIQD